MNEPIIANRESETAILAHALRHPEEYSALADIVRPCDFSWACFGWAWEAMQNIITSGMKLDMIVLADELERMGRLQDFQIPDNKQFTGRAALSCIRDVYTVKGSGESYAVTVSDYAQKRALREVANKIATWATNGRTASAIVADVENEFSKMVLHSGKILTHTMGMDEAVAKAMDATDKASKGERALKTGLNDLDKIIAIQKQELIVVAARPGLGKTALLCTILLNAADNGKRGLLFSVEMSGVSITQRFISQLSGISAFRIMNGNIREDEQEKYQQAADGLSGLPIVICDLPAIRIGQIRSESRKHKADFIALDYIQLANADQKNDRRDLDIGEVTRGLKALAKELDIPILAAAQLNRAVEGRGEKKPVLSDLRESGNIEQDADQVIFIYQKSEIDPRELIIAKHRNGPTGTVISYFNQETMRFSDGTTREVLPDYTR
jgi:replicative DNA helicase